MDTLHAAARLSRAQCLPDPCIWSQIKRAPKASKKRKVYEVDGPAKENAIPLKERARQIVSYFKKLSGRYTVFTHRLPPAEAVATSRSADNAKALSFVVPPFNTCRYNYETKEMGEVITFVGTYGASKGQAAALTFYTFVGASDDRNPLFDACELLLGKARTFISSEVHR
eukprot:1137879-Pelagomonas_calceolata.AAC.4